MNHFSCFRVSVCRSVLWPIVIAGLLLSMTVAIEPAAAAPGDEIVVFDDELRSGFQNWSWAAVDLASTNPVAEGGAAIAVTYGSYEGLYFGRNDLLTLPTSGTLSFMVHGGTGAAAPIAVQLIDAADIAGPIVNVTPTPGAWSAITIGLEDLGAISQIKGFWIQDASGTARSAIHVDSVRFVEGDAPAPVAGPALTIDLGSRSLTRTVIDPASRQSSDHTITFPHPISEGIYGTNFVPDSVREELDVTVNRWGGNGTERYNHLNGSTNIANDWFFQAQTDPVGGDHTFEDENQADGADTILTIPLSGWVANDDQTACSYEISAGVTYDESAPHNADGNILCGDGRRDGVAVGGADPTITSMAVDESFAAAWVQDLVNTHGDAASGGIEIYALGNEPGLWSSTHRDIRPNPIGREELIGRNQTYAAAIKAVDPTAAIAGPVLWSGFSYFVTTEEFEAGQRPGDVSTFVEDYLAGMQQASDQAGARLLDVLAVNFYDDRVYNGGTDTLRLESTRQLWDPTYAPTDWWVSRDFLYGDGSAVIPRLSTLIDQEYPGTDLAITEYNFGGDQTLAGGLAQADVLGIFGREGLDIATIWDPYAEWIGLSVEEYANRPLMHAFRLYRNYDGQGSKFGDESLYSASTDEAAVAIHGARRSADGAITAVVINKSTAPQTSQLTIDGVTGAATPYTYSGADLSSIVAGDAFAFDSTTSLSLPARSATLLVIAPSDDGGGGGGDGGGGEPITSAEVMHANSCLQANGRIDTNVVNPLATAATYRIEFEGLTARQSTVAPGDWWRMPITGRMDGVYTARVLRDGQLVSEQTVTVDCDDLPRPFNDPEVRVVNACRAGNGYVLFQFVNDDAATKPYVIEFEGVSNRSTSAAGFGQAIRAVTGRPNGTYPVTIRSGSTIIAEFTVPVAC